MKTKTLMLGTALILMSTIAQASTSGSYNPRDPNTNDRKAASCSFTSQANREDDRLIRPTTATAKPSNPVQTTRDNFVR